MSCSLSNARERPPTRAASGKHGCMLAQSLDLLPTETHPTTARSSTSSVSALRSSARLPWSVTCMSRSFRRTTRATRAKPYVANALLCWHPCVGLNARVRAVRAPARDVSSHPPITRHLNPCFDVLKRVPAIVWVSVRVFGCPGGRMGVLLTGTRL